MQIRGRAMFVGAAFLGAATLGLAAPAGANTVTPPTTTVLDCQRAFAATALQAILTFQASNKAPEAFAVLRGGLLNAQLGFTVCLGSVLQ